MWRRLLSRDSGISKKPSPCPRGPFPGPQLAILEMLPLANPTRLPFEFRTRMPFFAKAVTPMPSVMPMTCAHELNFSRAQGHRLLEAARDRQEMNTMQDHCSAGAAASGSRPITVSQDCHLLGIYWWRKCCGNKGEPSNAEQLGVIRTSSSTCG